MLPQMQFELAGSIGYKEESNLRNDVTAYLEMGFDVPVNKDIDENSSSRRGVSYPQDGDSAFTLVAKPQHFRDSDILDTNSTLPQASSSNSDNQLDIPDDSTEISEDNLITFKEHLKLCEEYANFAESTWKRVSMAAISSG